MPPQRKNGDGGVTLLELLVAMIVITILVAVVLAIGVESARYTAHADSDFVVQNEAQRALTRITEILHKTGRSTVGEQEYPQVWNEGDQLDFLLPRDRDGNGFAYDEITGELEWGPNIYTIRLDPATGVLAVHDGPTPVWVLGTHISEVDFATHREDPTVQFREIRVTIRSDHTTPDGLPISYTATHSIHMRN